MIFNPVVPIPKKIETIQARDVEVGNSVYLNESGSYVEYFVVNQGIPSNSSLYDSSCNGTWLLRKDIHSEVKWYSGSNYRNVYENSLVDTFLKGDFLNSLGDIEKSTIKQVKIPYRYNGGNSGTDRSGANGLSRKAFLLSMLELGFSKTSDLPNDGAALTYFSDNTNAKRIAYRNGSQNNYWTRSPSASSSMAAWQILYSGSSQAVNVDFDNGVRPALILPFNAEFDKTNMRLV